LALHLKLIKANIALFEGARLETQQLLQEYIDEQGVGWERDPYAPMVMWLDAQAQGNWEERVRRLYALVASVDAGNYYARLAHGYLQEEESFQEKLHPHAKKQRSRFLLFGVALWKAIFFILVGGIFTFGIITLFDQSDDSSGQVVAVGASSVDQGESDFANLPDKSQPVVADSYTARYDGGILQVLAIEDVSERIIDGRSSTLVTPVPGARFYTVSLAFECRYAICNDPPEATLSLQLDNGSILEMRSDVVVAGEPTFEAIALGRKTNGWAIFEIPAISRAEALLVIFGEDDVNTEPSTIFIQLP
jgi:hypothetical protein